MTHFISVCMVETLCTVDLTKYINFIRFKIKMIVGITQMKPSTRIARLSCPDLIQVSSEALSWS